MAFRHRTHYGYSPLRHVSIVTIAQSMPADSSLPTIVLPDGTFCVELQKFFRPPRYMGRSGSWRRLHADGVALFYDYYCARVGMEAEVGRSAMHPLANFAEALVYGTVNGSGGDKTGLYWPTHTCVPGKRATI